MSRLLRANFARLWKSKFFWASFIFMAVMGAYIQLMTYASSTYDGIEPNMDGSFFPYILFIAFIVSIFSGLFVGVEYSDGTIRNKIVVGHSRGAIYFSNLLVSIAACILECAVYMLTALGVGLWLLGGFLIPIEAVLLTILTSLILVVALVSIFTMIAMICKNRTITEIICIIGMLILLFAGTYINSRLQEPEYYSGYVITDENGTFSEGTELNPNFLRGTERKVYEELYDIVPGGQIIQVIELSPNHLWQRMAYSGIIAILTTVAGLFIFLKKDLN